MFKVEGTDHEIWTLEIEMPQMTVDNPIVDTAEKIIGGINDETIARVEIDIDTAILMTTIMTDTIIICMIMTITTTKLNPSLLPILVNLMARAKPLITGLKSCEYW